MIKQIIKHELDLLLGRTPTEKEYKSAIKFLSESEGLDSLSQVKAALYDWRDNCCRQCSVCGDYCLTEETAGHDLDHGRWCCGENCLDAVIGERLEDYPEFRI